jgi:hypothetical protein
VIVDPVLITEEGETCSFDLRFLVGKPMGF